ncbi:hypothetical protein N1851_012380 [Merluccius polli]|uniref:SWIM-type domain-containing protein n=1 Tax=Merluccius polli TaxID=89951 RepID=A0AA47P4E3_MERPO|nr:hypothetical protein N1851_012380 [Merluccius polli]
MQRFFATSLVGLPRITFEDVHKIVESHSPTPQSRLRKGYKFFVEEFIHNCQVTQFLWCSKITLVAVGQLALSEHSCSCAAGKGFCSHVTTLLFQTAHYVQLGLHVVPPSLACTSQPQMSHRPRTQGIHPEAVSDLVVKKPKSVGKTGVKSTFDVSSRAPTRTTHLGLSEIRPRPLISHILEGISSLELVPSQFGPVPRGCTLSYQCPPLTPDKPVIDFPPLPLPGFSFISNLAFVPNLHQALHLVTKSFPNYSLRN